MTFHFFTDEDAITKSQVIEEAYGPLPDQGDSMDRFNLQNSFEVKASASAFAITRSLMIAMESEGESSSGLLNLVLFPIENNFMAGFPVKFFIYRGIDKSSLLDEMNHIRLSDETWSENNILTIIEAIQSDLNKGREENEKITADSNTLGLQFGNEEQNKNLESLFLDPNDSFQPLPVPEGYEIGKFKGGESLASIQVVLDKIGNKANVSLLKRSNHIIDVEQVNSSTTTLAKDRFINRVKKEEVLAYMDITAFYGACINQGLAISGISNDQSFLSSFYNKDVVYLDIRDNRGFSYNHFFELSDHLQIGFQNEMTGRIEYEEINFYDKWPILMLRNRAFNANEKFFFIKIPIALGMPVHTNILTSYTQKVSFGPSQRDRRYMFLNQQGDDGTISVGSSEPIRLKNWHDASNQLGANQFLLKLDRIVPTFDKASVLSPIWDSFFSLDMENVFSNTGIQDGEFRVKTYASINAPLLVASGGEEVYYPIIGIAADKYQITFFTFYLEPAAQLFKIPDEIRHSKVIDTGKFKFKVNNDRLSYTEADQAVGFLYQFANNERIKDYDLAKEHFTVTGESGLEEIVEFLHYKKIGETNQFDDFIDNFQAISLTYAEYEHLKSLSQQSTGLSEDYIMEHPFYLSSSGNKTYDQNKFLLVETLLTLGVARMNINETGDDFIVEMSAYPSAIEVAGEPITLRSVTYN